MSLSQPFDWQGHRGARGLLPENTIPAFTKALELGVMTLEMDTAISSDGEVVVSHEPWMNHEICLTPEGTRIPEADRMRHNLYKLTYEQIKAFDCGSLGHPRFPQQQAMKAHKPLLRDVIRMAEQHVITTQRAPIYYNIEIKSLPLGDNLFHPTPAVYAQKLYDVLKSEGILERAVVQSFDVRALKAIHTLDATVQLAYLVEKEVTDFEVAMSRLDFTPAIYSPDQVLVTSTLIKQVHARNMRIIPWTVNTTEAMQSLVALGVDGIITDYPNLIFEVER